jgi:hypothetical protein
MTNSAGAVHDGLVLRLSFPASGDIFLVGPEMAVKLAEQLGLDAAQAERTGQVVTELTRQVDPSGASDVAFEFHKTGAELKIQARQGTQTSEARVSLGA